MAAGLLLAWYHGVLPAPSGPALVRFGDGRVLEADSGDHTQRTMLLDRFEPREAALVARLLAPGELFVDVGAHVGWLAVVGARAVGPDGRVVAFEAFPDNARALERNVELNGLGQVDVRRVAVSDRAGVARMGREAGGDSGTASGGAQAVGELVEVEQTTLDDALGPEAAPALLKVDVEGLEARVLAGGAGVLSRTGAALVEVNREALAANGASPEEVAGALAAAGLVRQRVLTRRSGLIQPGFELRPERPRGGRGLPAYGNLLAERG